MKFLICVFILIIPFKSLWASHIFHLEKKDGVCKWKIYDVKKERDKSYFQTPKCPNQIVWLKDKSFYYSIGYDVYWANRFSKTPQRITNIKSARNGYDPSSEVIWGVKGKYNALHAMVIDPRIKHMRVDKVDTYEFRNKSINPLTFKGVANEKKAAGVIRRWLKGDKKWTTESVKLVGRYNNSHFDEDLYNVSVLSSRQIVNYNECAENNCEKLPSKGFWDLSRFEKKLNFNDNGIETIGYMPLENDKGILFKKALDEELHPVKPFLLCEDNCEKMTEVELPESFSDNYAMVKKGKHYLITNDSRGSVASLYNFQSAKPVKEFKGPMVFWHPF